MKIHHPFQLGGVAFLLLASLTASVLTGCGGGYTEERGQILRTGPSAEYDISQTVVDLSRVDKVAIDQREVKTLYELNRWLKAQDPLPDWKPDPMLKSLPQEYQQLLADTSPTQMAFSPIDVDYLLEVSWMKRLSLWMTDDFQDPSLELFVTQEPKGEDVFSDKEAGRLLHAMRFFDWTVRHLQQAPVLPHPKDEAIGPSTGPTNEGVLKPGPGYMSPPWKTLLFGMGDSLQRARALILLCRQAGLDAVMLGFDDGQRQSRVKPWIPAVAIDGELYLFDPQLGLPIPGPDRRGVATLSQVLADPGLLRQLDISGEEPFEYPVKEEQLKHIVALIDASPESQSMRMKLLETRLTGAAQMEVTVSPSALSERIKACAGIEKTQLWALPWETLEFSIARAEFLAVNEVARNRVQIDERMLFDPTNMSLGRRRHLRGELDASDDEQGAKMLYLTMRLSEDEIQRIPESRQRQRELGVDRALPRNPQLRAMALQNLTNLMRNAKTTVGFWLALAHYDSGDYASAVDWFSRIRKDPGGVTIWNQSATYNQGRSLEALGKFAEARDLYYGDVKTPQRHGNLLRARLLIGAEDRADEN